MSTRRIGRVKQDRSERRDDGSLRTDAVIYRVGVFPYQMSDGTQMEFSPPEEVGSADTLRSFEYRPVLHDHPAEGIVETRDEDRELLNLMRGITGVATFDGEFIHTEIVLLDRDSAATTAPNTLELSPGYFSRVVPVADAMDIPSVAKSPGLWKGQRYTHVQRSIRGNHLARVVEGRQGPLVSLRLNSANSNTLAFQLKTDEHMDPTTITIMGRKFEGVPVPLVSMLEALIAMGHIPTKAANPNPEAIDPAMLMGDSSKTEPKPVTVPAPDVVKSDASETEKLRAALDDAKTKLGQMVAKQAQLPDQIRLDIAFELDAAKFAGVEATTFSGKTKREIMEAVIASKCDGVDLSKKSDDYVQCRFDLLVEEGPTDSNPLSVLRTASTPSQSMTKTDVADMLKTTQSNWARRGTQPLLVTKTKG